TDEVRNLLDTHHLHFILFRFCKRTHTIITEESFILINLCANIFGDVAITRLSKSLFRHSEDALSTNFPDTQSRSTVVDRQPTANSEAASHELRMFAARFVVAGCWR